jgi:hypothetical protein
MRLELRSARIEGPRPADRRGPSFPAPRASSRSLGPPEGSAWLVCQRHLRANRTQGREVLRRGLRGSVRFTPTVGSEARVEYLHVRPTIRRNVGALSGRKRKRGRWRDSNPDLDLAAGPAPGRMPICSDRAGGRLMLCGCVGQRRGLWRFCAPTAAPAGDQKVAPRWAPGQPVPFWVENVNAEDYANEQAAPAAEQSWRYTCDPGGRDPDRPYATTRTSGSGAPCGPQWGRTRGRRPDGSAGDGPRKRLVVYPALHDRTRARARTRSGSATSYQFRPCGSRAASPGSGGRSAVSTTSGAEAPGQATSLRCVRSTRCP